MNEQDTSKTAVKRLYMAYFTGFVWSLLLTLAAFTLTQMQIDLGDEAYPKAVIIGSLAVLAIVQLIVQLVFFFHLGREPKPRLNTVSFLFMLMVVGIIGFGSLWIMYNLNYNMMGQEVEAYIQKEENIYRDVSPSHEHH